MTHQVHKRFAFVGIAVPMIGFGVVALGNAGAERLAAVFFPPIWFLSPVWFVFGIFCARCSVKADLPMPLTLTLFAVHSLTALSAFILCSWQVFLLLFWSNFHTN